jgi:hypothetical protein
MISFEKWAIPAQAGMQPVVGVFPTTCEVNSRIRGNGGTMRRKHLANETANFGTNG